MVSGGKSGQCGCLPHSLKLVQPPRATEPVAFFWTVLPTALLGSRAGTPVPQSRNPISSAFADSLFAQKPDGHPAALLRKELDYDKPRED